MNFTLQTDPRRKVITFYKSQHLHKQHVLNGEKFLSELWQILEYQRWTDLVWRRWGIYFYFYHFNILRDFTWFSCEFPKLYKNPIKIVKTL